MLEINISSNALKTHLQDLEEIRDSRKKTESKMSLIPFNNFSGQPRGLTTLFFTELWERFSYYGMRAILVLYLISDTHSQNPGLGWSNEDAIQLYGWYTALVYLACTWWYSC